ncbi:S8 family peptidase [Longimicrobium sp.]|uniref:S8 family peptidase n=1 Tax=Longimicrobium sp. TaxID=2029185 RepID=UPI002C03A910|nr:S8 family serine peptidase [Longimicrobium sp.]HSU14302.1 S8 family serine peptidase [Longimicrobium sp.]
MIDQAPDRPWAPERSRQALRGRVLVRVAPGEAPERVPHRADVAAGLAVAPLSFDGGHLDRAVKRFSPALRVVRAFAPAARIGNPGAREHRWSDLEHETGLARMFRIDVDPEADLVALIDHVGGLSVIESVSPVYLAVTPFRISVERYGAPRPVPKDPWYAHRMIHAAEALAMEPGDSALILAVVDSGIDLHHPELEGALRPGFDTVDLPDDQVPRTMRLVGDFSRPDKSPQDEVGHGTACAGIIAAKGERLPKGIGGAVRVMPARALAGAQMVGRETKTAMGSLMDIDLAVKMAVDLGARVLNLSFGTPESSLRERDPRPHKEIVDYARRRGCILVAASGNSGSTARYYPACLDGVIAVGAVGPDQHPTDFTTRGDHVDLCAPGESIPSTAVGGYQLNTGTSFASPLVAGVAALVAARSARYSEPIGGEEVRELLKRTARPFPRGADAAGCGAGILDARAAVEALERDLSAGDGEGHAARPAPVREPSPAARSP